MEETLFFIGIPAVFIILIISFYIYFIPRVKSAKLNGTYSPGWLLIRLIFPTILLYLITVGSIVFFDTQINSSDMAGIMSIGAILYGLGVIPIAVLLFVFIPIYFFSKTGTVKTVIKTILIVIVSMIIAYFGILLANRLTCGLGNDTGCMMSKAFKQNDPDICQKADDPDYCYLGLGLPLRSLETCNKIMSDKTRYYCYEDFADESGDKSICDMIPVTFLVTDTYDNWPPSRQRCLERVAP